MRPKVVSESEWARERERERELNQCDWCCWPLTLCCSEPKCSDFGMALQSQNSLSSESGHLFMWEALVIAALGYVTIGEAPSNHNMQVWKNTETWSVGCTTPSGQSLLEMEWVNRRKQAGLQGKSLFILKKWHVSWMRNEKGQWMVAGHCTSLMESSDQFPHECASLQWISWTPHSNHLEIAHQFENNRIPHKAKRTLTDEKQSYSWMHALMLSVFHGLKIHARKMGVKNKTKNTSLWIFHDLHKHKEPGTDRSGWKDSSPILALDLALINESVEHFSVGNLDQLSPVWFRFSNRSVGKAMKLLRKISKLVTRLIPNVSG